MSLLLFTVPSATWSAGVDYRIGADDVLTISVWDQKDLDQVVFVRPDGKISLPLVGEVEAQGLTVSELASRLTEMYQKSVRNAYVTVGVKEIRSRTVFFVGGVGKPGPLQLTQDLTLLQAVAAAGGLIATADLESAYVIRGNRRIAVDFVKLTQQGDITQNITVQPGDTIVVPVAGVVFVQGEVRTPGSIKFSRDLTILKALAQAGGLTVMAAPKRVTVLRIDGTKKETIRINVSELMTHPEAAADLLLKPNDIVTVPQRLF